MNACIVCYLFSWFISVCKFCSSLLVACAWQASLTRSWCNEYWNVLHPSPWSGTLCLKCRYWALKWPRTPPWCKSTGPLSVCVCVRERACLPEGFFFCQESVFALSLSSEMHAPLSSDSPEWHSHGRVPARQLPVCPFNRLIKLFWSPALPRLPSGLHLLQLFQTFGCVFCVRECFGKKGQNLKWSISFHVLILVADIH